MTAPVVSAVDRLHEAHDRITEQLSRVIVGQREVIEELLISLFSRGHYVTREEFEVVKAMAEKARAENERLSAELAKLKK